MTTLIATLMMMMAKRRDNDADADVACHLSLPFKFWTVCLLADLLAGLFCCRIFSFSGLRFDLLFVVIVNGNLILITGFSLKETDIFDNFQLSSAPKKKKK